jgi:hypothetical protein
MPREALGSCEATAIRSSRTFNKPIERHEMEVMLEPAMFLGLGAVAVWMYFRFPGLRPGSLVRAAVHVAVSFLGFALLPATLGVLLPGLASHGLRTTVALALLISELTYLLLSWVWLVARILQDLLGGTPRGGHPVSSES